MTKERFKSGKSPDSVSRLNRLKTAVQSAEISGSVIADWLAQYAAALRYWAAWFQLRYRQPLTLPMPTAAVLQFLVDHVEREDANDALVHELPPAIDAALVAAITETLNCPCIRTARCTDARASLTPLWARSRVCLDSV